MNYISFLLISWTSIIVPYYLEQLVYPDDTLNVMSYNVKYCAPYKSSEPNIDSIAKIITYANADIVFLQEIDRNTTRSGKVDQLAILAEKTGLKHYFYGKAISYQGGETGLGILSRYPLSEQEIHDLPRVELEGKYVSYRILMSASVKVGNKRLTIANTHMELTLENRELQVPAIDSILSQSSYPVIFGGDFNATPDGPTMTAFFQRHFKSSCEGNASCYTIPSRKPDRKLDYILFRPQSSFKIIDHKILHTEASDHLPIITTFTLK
ncbi:endonuclease/exonuclease/phosphatase family protein [Echinicola shivajiensis]|uniref:endonuclease/exonuclease/phosphatase family protein n=1 Tax=Echinicola shivajiensis TaxID=1035916 RepID=UPI001BFC89D7|nr:endonuclease/exonuclease/phosphatase family protein [Echinicola shivajiensis]